MEPLLLEALAGRPDVLLIGARQSGKTTLVRTIIESGHDASYISFDDAPALAAARSDPPGFLAGHPGPVVLDEIQRVPSLFLAIKPEVDRRRESGRFLLTGSADPLLLPDLADALPGRMEILRLWPRSQGEIEGRRAGRFVKRPKLLIGGSGLQPFLIGVDADRLAKDQGPLEGSLENFVVMEIVKQPGWSLTKPALFHFRTRTDREVDLVLESRSGQVVGVEIKSSANITHDDFQGLRALSEAAGKYFHRGVILYGGVKSVPFGERLHAIPIGTLWGPQRSPAIARQAQRRSGKRPGRS